MAILAGEGSCNACRSVYKNISWRRNDSTNSTEDRSVRYAWVCVCAFVTISTFPTRWNKCWEDGRRCKTIHRITRHPWSTRQERASISASDSSSTTTITVRRRNRLKSIKYAKRKQRLTPSRASFCKIARGDKGEEVFERGRKRGPSTWGDSGASIRSQAARQVFSD